MFDEATFQKARVLVVDDQAETATMLGACSEREGYANVVTTSDSSQVVGLCARTPPDLVLLDLHMPAPDGYEVMEMLQPWIEGRWFPILVLVGRHHARRPQPSAVGRRQGLPQQAASITPS